MIPFLLRRLLETLPLLFLLSLMIFALFQLVPGDYLSEMAMNPAVPAGAVERMRDNYGLNDPFYWQYLKWLGQIFRGNLGYSFLQQRPAVDLIVVRLWNTLQLALPALLLSLFVSLLLVVLSVFYKGSWLDRAGLLFSVVGLSVPTVLSALLLLYFAYWTGWFPIGGKTGLSSFVMPVTTLALPLAAFLFRTLRLELMEALDQPYILSARARGLPRAHVIQHALRNALNPLISLSGILLGGLLSGSVVVEEVFNWPGLGALTVAAILQRDLYVALNSVLVGSVLVVLANLIADMTLAWIDPRVRYS